MNLFNQNGKTDFYIAIIFFIYFDPNNMHVKFQSYDFQNFGITNLRCRLG